MLYVYIYIYIYIHVSIHINEHNTTTNTNNTNNNDDNNDNNDNEHDNDNYENSNNAIKAMVPGRDVISAWLLVSDFQKLEVLTPRLGFPLPSRQYSKTVIIITYYYD